MGPLVFATIFRYFFRITGWALRKVITAAARGFVAIRREVAETAEFWKEEAVNSGRVGTGAAQEIYWAFYTLALIEVVAGWIVMSFLVVWLVNRIF